MNKNSKIYIAGHKGLVGSAILGALQIKGYSNFVLRSHSELDLTDQKAVEQFFAAEKPEYVFLAAAKVGGIMANNTYRGQFIYQNLQIQNNIIHNSWKTGVKKLLFLGSTCIYPREAPQPMPEDCLLTGPLEYTNEPYAIAKIAGIKLCESYNLQYDTNFISVMPTNLYGPNDNFDLEKSHVLPAMIRKIYLGKCLEENNLEAIRQDLDKRPVLGKKNLTDAEIIALLKQFGINADPQIGGKNPEAVTTRVEISLWGSGSPLREFLWSEDMAEACVHVMENIDFNDLAGADPVTQAVRNTHINIGTGREISIRSLAELIQKKVGFKGKITFDPSKPDGTLRKLTDPSKLHSLGWKHTIEIEEGVEKLYNWYLEKGDLET